MTLKVSSRLVSLSLSLSLSLSCVRNVLTKTKEAKPPKLVACVCVSMFHAPSVVGKRCGLIGRLRSSSSLSVGVPRKPVSKRPPSRAPVPAAKKLFFPFLPSSPLFFPSCTHITLICLCASAVQLGCVVVVLLLPPVMYVAVSLFTP